MFASAEKADGKQKHLSRFLHETDDKQKQLSCFVHEIDGGCPTRADVKAEAPVVSPAGQPQYHQRGAVKPPTLAPVVADDDLGLTGPPLFRAWRVS